MTTVYWVEEGPGKYAAFHELREREKVEEIPGIGKVLVLYTKQGWPNGAVKIVAEQDFEPILAEAKA